MMTAFARAMTRAMTRLIEPRTTLLLFGLLLFGAALRLTGLQRGDSDFVLPEAADRGATRSFYSFHPDEEALIRAALEFDHPQRPPLTAYGAVPLYLARAAISTVSAISGTPAGFVSYNGRRAAVFSLRILSVIISCLSLWLLWQLGHRYFSSEVALFAVLMACVVPVAIQQAHFFTVDGLFSMLVTASVLALLTAAESRRRSTYLLCGVLIGLTAATRLNGLSIWCVLLAAHILFAPPGAPGRFAPRRLVITILRGSSGLWLAGVVAVATLILLQPYLISDPHLLWQSQSTSDFAYSVSVATGQILRPWSLVDVHTTPFLHYWTHLWPLGVGWPLTVSFLVGVGAVLWRPNRVTGLMLFVLLIQFLLVGGLHTKHVRYLLPMLPFHCLLAADLVRKFGARTDGRRRPASVTLGIVCAVTACYGVAFAGIYLEEDSRITAGRWIAAHVPAGSAIGIERGGFSMTPLVSRERFSQEPLNLSALFSTRGYLNCAAAARFLNERTRLADYIVFTDVNRFQQFTSAPELYPAAASFYRELVEGHLGFDLVQRFKQYPAVGPVRFEDDGTEPSFIGYDHPAVYVLQRSAAFEVDWQQWREALGGLPGCSDGSVIKALALANGDLPSELEAIERVAGRYPEDRYIAFIEADLYSRSSMKAEELEAFRRFVFTSSGEDRSRSNYLLPWATAASLIEVGLDRLAFRALRAGSMRRDALLPGERSLMANSYRHIAKRYDSGDRADLAAVINQMAVEIETLSSGPERQLP